jgi:hypothetical protein
MENKTNSENNKETSQLERLLNLTLLLTVPGVGVIAGTMARKQLEHPFDTYMILGFLEYAKFQGYASLPGTISTYFC